MPHQVYTPSPPNQARTRWWRMALRPPHLSPYAGGRPPLPPDYVVVDEQIASLVRYARSLARRQRDRHAIPRAADEDERLRSLDWVVRAGERELTGRAAARDGAVQRHLMAVAPRAGQAGVP